MLQVMEKEGEYRLTLQENGRDTEYDVSLHVCDNPACRCTEIEMILSPAMVGGEPEGQKQARLVSIDVMGKKLSNPGQRKNLKLDRDFAKAVFEQLEEEDFQFLQTRFLAAKNLQTEKADPEEIEVFFEYDKIEEDGLLTGYNDILPYADHLVVTMDEEECLVLDQYCLRNGCACSNVLLSLFVMDQSETAGARALGDYFVDYRKKIWWSPDDSRIGRGDTDLKKVRHSIEEQLPSIYSVMKERHTRLTKMYRHSCEKQGVWHREQAQAAKVGRNEPCPCGSGKKYKRCCLGK
ncbi:hypothetical protein C4565_03420 [Candidatus Parcubacteria bacterium]|nr:MAG: hypothetical protein C4565_03420 [Candidatus Parcubacteria bacterium]